MSGDSWDYVVVGGGSAGSIVAGRLAHSGARVLVLEAGGTDRRPDVVIPAGVVEVYRTCNWRYVPEPDPSREGAVEPWPAGRILGGGGSINATVFVRGHPADFDSWDAQGASGWNYESVLPYFRRMETWDGGVDEFRGGQGPIHVRPHTMDHAANDAFVRAAQQAGHTFTEDYNGKNQVGVGHIQVNQRRGTRSQASREYLRGLGGTRKPQVLKHARATRVVFEVSRAVGVEYVERGGAHLARVRQEVILSAGTLISPKLLMVSGIGPADELKRHGIDALVDNPGVGGNLREHAIVMQRWHATVPTLNTLGPVGAVKAVADWVLHGRGPMAATVMHVQVMHRGDPKVAAPTAQICFATSLPSARSLQLGCSRSSLLEPTDSWLRRLCCIHDREVAFGCAAPIRPTGLLSKHQLLGNRDDLADLLAAMAEGRRIMDQPAMTHLVRGMFDPENTLADSNDWARFARQVATYGAHPIGTCRMGIDAEAVVDPQLRVHGVAGLRVIDASVMPSHPSGNTNASTMMIGEKGADMIVTEGRP